MMFVSFNRNKKGASNRAGTAYPSEAPRLIPGF